MFPKARPWSLLIGLLSLPMICTAGQITLKNGDIIKGEIAGIHAETVLWKSDSFGPQRIDKTKVADIESTAPLKIPGHDQPCQLAGLQAEYLRYHCKDSGETSVSLFTLNNVQPFTAFKDGDYIYKGRASLSGTFNRGNLNQDDLDVEAQASFQRGEFRHVLETAYENLTVENDESKEKFKLRYRLDWFFGEQWFWYNESELGRDDNRNVDQYLLLGSGVGYEVWNNIDGKLDVEAGGEYSLDNFHVTETDLTDPEFETGEERIRLRLGNDFEYRLYGETSMFNRNKLLYSLNDLQDWEFSSDSGLNVPLGAGLFSEVVLEFDHVNQPSGDSEKSDTKVTLGVGYQW